MTIITTSEETHSNNHNLTDLPIQITSIELDVTKNPSQTNTAQIIPPHTPVPERYGEVEASKYTIDRISAVTKFDNRFQSICGIISESFSLPVG